MIPFAGGCLQPDIIDIVASSYEDEEPSERQIRGDSTSLYQPLVPRIRASSIVKVANRPVGKMLPLGLQASFFPLAAWYATRLLFIVERVVRGQKTPGHLSTNHPPR